MSIMMILAFGVLAPLPPSPEDELTWSVGHEKLVAEFERRGVEYAKGYVAASQCCTSPRVARWVARLKFEGPELRAVRQMLDAHGIDSFELSAEFSSAVWVHFREARVEARAEIELQKKPKFPRLSAWFARRST